MASVTSIRTTAWLGLIIVSTGAFMTTSFASEYGLCQLDCMESEQDMQMSVMKFSFNYTSLEIEFKTCFGCGPCLQIIFPENLFVQESALTRLTIHAPISAFPLLKQLANKIFAGLTELEELHLEGFERIQYLAPDMFTPLKNLKLLDLVNFGNIQLSYSALGDALQQFNGSPLQTIEMNGIHSEFNIDFETSTLVLDINQLFPNTSIKSLSFDNNIVLGVTGQPSIVLPDLVELTFSLSVQYASSLSFLLDCLLLHKNLERLKIYSYPIGEQYSLAYNKDRLKGLQIILNALRTFKNSNCYWGYEFPLIPTLKSITLNRFEILGPTFTDTVCFHVSNRLEYLDLSSCQLPSNIPLISGLNNLKTLNLSNGGIQYISMEQLKLMPQLETVILSYNMNLKFSKQTEAVENNLITIDLSNCGLTSIPNPFFEKSQSLETLNLSNNNLKFVDFSMISRNFSLLNVSSNSVGSFSIATMKSLQNSNNNFIPTVDLRNNPLHCFCNVTEFVEWIQAQRTRINFEGYNNYTCLYPNGTRLLMQQVDVIELKYRCSFLKEITNNSKCPCDDDKALDSLQRISASLDNFFCRYQSDKPLIPMSTLTKSACSQEGNILTSPAFLVPVIFGVVLLVVLVVVVALYRKRKKHVLTSTGSYDQFLNCLDVNRIVGSMMRILARETEQSRAADFDAFIYSHDDDFTTVRSILSLMAADLKVISADNFIFGASKVEAIEESLQKSRSIVLVISQSFVTDAWCRDVLIRSTRRQHAIIPILVEPVGLNEQDFLLTNLLKTNRSLHWSTVSTDEQRGETMEEMDKLIRRR